MPARELFDHSTALGKVGRRIRSLVEFSGVSQGTTAQVIQADPSGSGYTLAIQWELPEHRAWPLVNWFSRSEYDRFLVEV